MRHSTELTHTFCTESLERRGRSLSLPLGLSKPTKGGHLIVLIQCRALEQSFRLGATLECITVKVYDNVYPLRMEPPNGEFGSQKFNDFVDSLMSPILNKHPLTDAFANAGKLVLNDSADHTSFFIIKKDISLCYGLGMDMVHQDFPFQSIREKEFKREIKGMANS